MSSEPTSPTTGLSDAEFNQVADRLYSACDAKNRADLANILGISQPSVHRGFRDKALPSSWLLTFMCEYDLDPDWLMYGAPRKKHMVPTDEKPGVPDTTVVPEVPHLQ